MLAVACNSYSRLYAAPQNLQLNYLQCVAKSAIFPLLDAVAFMKLKQRLICLQAALIMKILRGQYRPVIGYSADLTDIVKRCLTQSAARRPDTGA